MNVEHTSLPWRMMMEFLLKRAFFSLLIALGAASLAFSQNLGEEVHLNIRQKVDSTSPADAGTYLNGYRKTIDGQQI
ncbi:MAG: hypothetical protein NTZ35_00470, partial [Ignavibacteriales bacterium]|nr:hypothetical protein [Ignavibacteriales bacterium]